MNVSAAVSNIGKIVHITDGTPRPPARFTRKVKDWEGRNYTGILTECEPNKWGDERCSISIEVKRMGNPEKPIAIFNRSGWLDDRMHSGEHPEAPADESIINRVA